MAHDDDRIVPMPVPRGDGRHDIGDDARAAIAQRLEADFVRVCGESPARARYLAMYAAAAVRALLHELGTLRDMADDSAGRAADLAFDPIRAAIDLGELVITPEAGFARCPECGNLAMNPLPSCATCGNHV